MINFADRLNAAIDTKQSCVVVGLDPRIPSLPPALRAKATNSPADAAEAILEFNRGVIRSTAPYAIAVKPQSAFYELLGWQGVKAYAETARLAREAGLLIIGDVKRGDIGTTAEAYAEAHFEAFGADAVTVNPYLGTDGIKPFLKYCAKGKGIFVLVKTSNPSSVELQDLMASGKPLYESTAALAAQWGANCVGTMGYSAVGAVVGATFPGAVAQLRKLMPHTIFLIPGYGAQGGSADDCARCFDASGHGAVVNSSRGIIFSYANLPETEQDARWEESVADAARTMRDDLERVRVKH